MMKITKLSLCVSMAGLLATLPAAYANEIVTNCTQVAAVDGGDTNATNNESCAKLAIPFDYGDAPDSFKTLDASGGARHQLGTDVYLGTCVDGDTGLLQGTASADNADQGSPVYGKCDPVKGDEDGVAIAPLHVGDTKNVVQVTANAACKLNAWVDWNHDGSWGGAGEQVFIDQVLSAGVNNLTMDVPAFAAEGTIYTRFRCSTAGGDGIGGEAADGEVEDYALNILPAIPKKPVSVGDTIWEDTNKDGKQSPGENPLAGATVTLMDSAGAPAKDLAGNIVAAVTTDSTGKYLFSNLPEGDYSVKVAPPTGYIPTLNAGDVDTVPANDDSNCAVQGDGSITTALFTLTAGTEPDAATAGDSNLTVDCGFYKPTEPTHSLGNKVWIDDGAGTKANANNGTLDKGEAVVADGVVVELRDAAGVLLNSTTTSKGFYLFSGLAAGDYKVCVAATNFAKGAILDGFSASTGGNEVDANVGVDSTDNGSDVLADGLCSNVITLDANAPTGEIDTASGAVGDDGTGTPDALSDLTVDFGVIPPKPAIPVSVGDTIWIDDNENGVQDKGELPLIGASVTLLNQDGTPVKDLAGNVVTYVPTDSTGHYLFSNLPEGDYTITVKAPDGYLPTKGVADVNTNTSNTDSNCAVVGSSVQTPVFSLIAGSQPINDGDTDANSNLSVDCGFYQPKAPVHSLGNRVWIDANNNGKADVGEAPAAAGVKLDLKDASGTVLASTATDAEGRYLFGGLAAGSYQVCVVADNFLSGNILAGYTASTGGNVADANTDIDGDDNGDDDTGKGLCSNVVVLDDKEPTGEAGIGATPGDDGIGTADNRSNLTVDFGIVPPAAPVTPVAVGDYLWIDTNQNGLQDAGETGLSGATVTLLDKAGQPAKDIQGNVVAPAVTGADGLYGFTKLPEGDYSISVKAPAGYIPTQNAGDVDDVPANNDSNCAVQGDGSVTSAPFTLTAGAEPGSAVDGDGANANQTVDCGFYQPTTPVHSIGNMVWVDNSTGDATKDNNGKFDKGETLLSGIKVELRDNSGAVIDSTMTTDGYYLFSGMTKGEYQVCVSASNFAGVGKLLKYTAGVNGKEADANADLDDNDNGDTTTGDGLCSNVIVLDDKEPTGELSTASGKAGDDGAGTEDNRSNLTVDFAVLAPAAPVAPKPVAVGDMIWIDANENGQQDTDEALLAGATVTLVDKAGKPVIDLAGNAVKPATTGADGKYLFSNLPEGEYSISVAAPQGSGYLPTKGGASVDADASNTDSNCAVSGSSIQTLPFNLTAGGEPIDDGDTDASSNLSVDCGFYLPKAPVHSIGNRVWVDTNNNGIADVGEEPAAEGIKLALKDASGTTLNTTTTDAAGRYLFGGLAAGSYQVCVVADNFAAGNILDGFSASTGGDLAAAISSNTDGDDNGDDDTSKGLCSNVVVLDGNQPLGEAGATAIPGDDGIGTEDARSNLTIDFGIVPPAAPAKPVSVGNYLWIDANEDGIQDDTEAALVGATVTLLDAKGAPAKNLDGGVVAAITTGADGQYLFDNLPAGDYSITVLPPAGGYVVTKGGADVDTDASNTDSNCAVVGSSIQTAPFTLTPDGEPTDDGDTDASSNLSVDCGFYVPKTPVHSLGNRVWIDTNNNGLADVGEEPATAGVKLTLKDASGTVLASTTTTADGHYLFGGLAAGSYQVCVVADNFAAGSLLEGYSASTGGNEANANSDIDGDDNGDDDTSKGLCSGMIVLDDKEPTGEAGVSATPGDDGIGTEDALSNLTIDFGIVPPAVPAKPVSVGNYLWIDANEDGIQDDTEAALAGATVTLLDAKGAPAKHLDGTVVAAITTGVDGQYLFDNLPEGDYSITVAAPAGYLPTKGGVDADADASNTDSNCSVVGSGVQTALFTLTAGGEPTDDGDTDANSNLSVDCGFYVPKTPVHSLGNKVWVDDGAGDATKANNGVMDAGEQPVVDGVVMELLDKNGKVITETPTKDGYYLFTGLDAGDYSVCVAHGNFDQGLLKGYTASTGGDEKDVNAGIDNGDNGDNDTQGGLCSGVITLDDKQPTGETPTASGKAGDDGMGTEDALSNLTVDFGVLPPAPVVKTVSVGDYIWIDANENGQQDQGELPLAGATVTLTDKDGKPVVLGGDMVVAPITTGADGKYLFSGLPEGEYTISVAAPNGSGYLPTKGGAKVDADASNTDSNCSVDTGKTSLFTLTAGAEPDVSADGDGTDGNMTVDCGFYLPKEPTHSIGNMVWVDNGTGANANNGKFDAGETLPNGVNVELRDKDGVLITSTQTVAGFYLFDGLKAGDYQVCVAGSNFNKGAALDGYTASSVAGEADANANGDNNNNGDNTASDGLCSNVIVLDDKEPTGETPTASGTAGDDGKGTADNRSNLTVDFAVVPVEPVKPGTPVSVGNQIWVDSNANGKRDEGESLLAGAVVTLTDASGRTVTDLDGKPVSPHTTGKDGLYVFGNLPEGDYIITVEPPAGFFPTVGGIDADDDASDYDSNCRVNPINGTIETQPFTLKAGTEPDADGDGTNGNMTVDCGFYGSVSLGNKIWLDDNANGQQDNAEPGIAGITVSLMEEDGITPATDISGGKVAAVTTDANGNYLFDNLKPGNYIVVVNPGKDSGYSLTKGGADPDTDPSNTDSNCKVVAGTFQTPAVTLMPGSEPGAAVDGDDESRNSTVDCGLFRPVNLGSRLWIDLNGDGKQSGGEPGVPGATVTLLTVDGKPVTDVFGDVLKPQTTDADGKYFFGNLREGAYVVKVIPPAGYLPTVAVTDPNNNDGTDSNGIMNTDGSIVSKPIDLKWGQEPSNGGATNTTVGFGLIANLHVPTLSQWGTAIMSMLLATAAFFRRRRED